MTVQHDGQQPLTRRQLREMERAAAAGKGAVAAVAPSAAPEAVGSELPAPVSALHARPEAAAEAAAEPELVESAPLADAEPVVSPASLVQPAPEAESARIIAAAPAAPQAPAEPEPEIFKPVLQEAEPVTAAIPVAQRPIAATLPDHPLTRRELRALLAQQQADAARASETTAAAAEPLAAAAPNSTQAEPAPVEEIVDAEVVGVVLAPESATPAAAQASEIVVEEAKPEPVAETDGPRTFSPPTGHWSLAASESFDDILSATEDAHSRSVESSGTPGSANALIIPTVPSAADVTAPLDATGEILLTGSIDLPRSLGATGQIPNRFDGADLDRLYEQHESGDAGGDSAPVSATRAISTHTTSRNVIAPPKNRGTRWVPVLAITAGVLAAATGGLFAAGYIFHIF